MKFPFEIPLILGGIGLYIWFIQPSYEVLFVIGILAFYLLDSRTLLSFDEFLLVNSNGTWSYVFPNKRWYLNNKTLHILNPFSPNSLPFKVSWRISNNRNSSCQNNVDVCINCLKPIRSLAMVELVILLVSIPITVFLFGLGLLFLVQIALVYLIGMGILVWIWRYRDTLKIPKKYFIGLVADSILCPPLSINVSRKIALQCSLNMNSMLFAKSHMDSKIFYRLKNEVLDEIYTSISKAQKGSRIFWQLKRNLKVIKKI